jgi:hypothetical protein
MTDRNLFVHVDLEGVPYLVGRLWGRSRKGKESATFEYDAAWLANPLRFALEPALTLGKGPHHLGTKKAFATAEPLSPGAFVAAHFRPQEVFPGVRSAGCQRTSMPRLANETRFCADRRKH